MTVLDQICLNIIDCEHKTAPIQDSGIPSIRTTDIKGGVIDFRGANKVSEETYKAWTERLEPQPQDLILAREAPVGEIGIIPKGQRACLGQRTVLIRPNPDKVYPHYLLYLMQSRGVQHEMQIRAAGSTVEHLNMCDIRELNLPELPPLEVQYQIGDTLANLDRKIENLRKQNETLEAIAQTLFQHWFVDFEFPNEDGKPYKSSGGEMVRSELGEIPAGWQLLELGDVATNHSETHKFENKSEIIFINTGDVLEGNFLHHDYSPIKSLPGQAKKKIRQNDILYSEIRPINKRFAYVNLSENLDDYVVSTKFMVVRSNGKILPRLLYLILKRDSTIQQFHYIAESRSGTFPQITFESVYKFPIVIPEMMLQEKLMSVITPLLEKREFNTQRIETLTKTRDVLLPQLMSGKLRITE
jgi:type I restriction enzyme S subunit